MMSGLVGVGQVGSKYLEECLKEMLAAVKSGDL
jgi:hypothetical protein